MCGLSGERTQSNAGDARVLLRIILARIAVQLDTTRMIRELVKVIEIKTNFVQEQNC
jgi:hypothetical protein